MNDNLVPTMTALPYTVREFFEQEAKKQGVSLSPYLRDLLIAFYKTEVTLRNLRKSEYEKAEEEKFGEKDD